MFNTLCVLNYLLFIYTLQSGLSGPRRDSDDSNINLGKSKEENIMKQMQREVVLSKNQLCEYTSINGTSHQLTAEPLSGDQPA